MSEKSTKDGLQIIYDFVTDCANAIREVEGSTGKMKGTDVPARIRSIESGVDTTDANAVAGDIRFGKTAYVNEAKVTGLLEDYDGSFEGEGFEELMIPKVEITQFAPDGVINWKAVSIPGIEEYAPYTIKYTVTVNGYQVSSGVSNTTYNAKSYIRLGTNTVSIGAIITLTRKGANSYSTCEYIVPNLGIEVLNIETSLLTKPVAVGNIIYSFSKNKIQKYNTQDNTIDLIDFNSGLSYDFDNVVAVGTNIYLFRWTNIYKYDTLTDTFSQLDYKLTNYADYAPAVSINNIIYTIGAATIASKPSSASIDYSIQEYDTLSGTILVWESKAISPRNAAAIVFGTDIYLFGGQGSGRTYNSVITKLDTVSRTTSYTGKYLPAAAIKIGIGIIDDNIYLFGGTSGDGWDPVDRDWILKYNVTYNYIETLAKVIPYPATGIPTCTVGDAIYLMGGIAGNAYYEIFKFTVEEES